MLWAICWGRACTSCMTGCDAQRTPEQVHAELLHKLPVRLPERETWARDIQAAFKAQDIPPTTANLCAALAVVEQESSYRADPPVPELGRISIAEIKRRAAAKHVPAFMVDAALALQSPDGRSYAQPVSYTHLDVYKRQVQKWGDMHLPRVGVDVSAEACQ